MGIKGLMKLISDEAPDAISEGEIKTYFGRKVAIDASMSIYQFLIAVRSGPDGQQLTNADGEVTSHVSQYSNSTRKPTPAQDKASVEGRLSFFWFLCSTSCKVSFTGPFV
jgi:hypothetical protein